MRDSVSLHDHDTSLLQQQQQKQHTQQFGAKVFIPNPFGLQMRKVKDKMTFWKYSTS